MKTTTILAACAALLAGSFAFGSQVLAPALAERADAPLDLEALRAELVHTAESSPRSERQIPALSAYASSFADALRDARSPHAAASAARLQAATSCAMATMRFSEFHDTSVVLDDIVDATPEGHARHMHVLDLLSYAPQPDPTTGC